MEKLWPWPSFTVKAECEKRSTIKCLKSRHQDTTVCALCTVIGEPESKQLTLNLFMAAMTKEKARIRITVSHSVHCCPVDTHGTQHLSRWGHKIQESGPLCSHDNCCPEDAAWMLESLSEKLKHPKSVTYFEMPHDDDVRADHTPSTNQPQKQSFL